MPICYNETFASSHKSSGKDDEANVIQGIRLTHGILLGRLLVVSVGPMGSVHIYIYIYIFLSM